MFYIDEQRATQTKNPVVTAVCVGMLLGIAQPAIAADNPAMEPIRTQQIAESGSNIAWGHAEVVLDQPVSEVLAVLADYAQYARFVPNFTRSKVLARRGSRAKVYIEVSVAAGTLTLWGQLDLSERPGGGDTRVIEAQLLEGNVDAFKAEWRVEPLDDGARTRVTFRIYVDPDLPLPAALLSRENERAARRTLQALQSTMVALQPHPLFALQMP